MKQAPVAIDDDRRLVALRSYEIVGTPPEAAYDAIVRLVAELCGMPVALVTLVDETSLWVKSRVGHFPYVPERATSFCGHTVAESSDLFVVEDASEDLRFHDNPFVIGEPFIRCYASAPIVPSEGWALGALCVIDFVPRVVSEHDRLVLALGARAIAALLDEHRVTRRLDRAIAERRTLAFAAHHDALTKLPNRAYVIGLLDARLRQIDARPRVPFAVMFLDVDGFKAVNDTYGHVRGDEVLIAISKRLARIVRGSDVVARIGGDEFIVLVDHATDLMSLSRLADRFVRAIAVPFHLGEIELAMTMSVGIVVATEKYDRVEDLIAEADAAMFAAKAAGRNRFEFSRSDGRARAPSRHTKRF